ncbi:MAG: hypothetical protein ACJA04_000840 [Cellvibrionaceae bacterium]|jgi:hypothetical protein
MKIFWPWLAKILFVVVIFEGWLLYDFYQKNRTLIALSSDLQDQLNQTEKNLAETTEQLQAVEKKTLEGMFSETNKAMISGWELLLDRVQEELNKAREQSPEPPDNSEIPQKDHSQPSTSNTTNPSEKSAEIGAETPEEHQSSTAVKGKRT